MRERFARRSYLASKARELVPLAPGFFGGAVAKDPYWNNVVLLMRFDGANGSTTFTDLKGHAVTSGGGTQVISTAQSKFGGSSLFTSTGATSYLSSATSTDWDILSGDFTIEAWLYISSLPAGYSTLVSRNADIGGWQWRIQAATGVLEWVYPGVAAIGWGTLGANAWQHVAICRQGAQHYQWINGANGAFTFGTVTTNLNAALWIGRGGGTNVFHLDNAYIDELRITKGVARYTTAFTPPTSPFPGQ